MPVFSLRKVRARAFYDGGVLSEDSWDIGGDYLSDVGLGVDLFLLGDSPLRFDLAWPLEKDEFTDDGPNFLVNFGYRF